MIRIGVIGCGNMGSQHCKTLLNKQVDSTTLTAVCDSDPQKLRNAKLTFGEQVQYFDTPDSFLENAPIDAVLIATAHYAHPALAAKALKRNLHVLIEKPAGVYTKAVRETNSIAEKSGRVFGIMYNQRTNPVYQKARELMQNGTLGELKRVCWIVTDWYRSQSYYQSGGWRATWAGEGGGVLLNQCPHNLDLWQWICGMPSRIKAQMYFGKYHDIEVEDDVTAFAEYPNGATGVFITSTHETPGTNRLEISADNGKLIIEDGELVFYRNIMGEREFNATYTKGFGQPECWKCQIPIAGAYTGHAGILQNFIDAIIKDTPLISPGAEGINGLLISNAMHLSAWTGEWVSPEEIDEDLFLTLLNKRISESTTKKAPSISVLLDVNGTY